MAKIPMGFQIFGATKEYPELEDVPSPELQRITAIPASPTSSIHRCCNMACEAMNRGWPEKAPEIGGAWVCERDPNHYSIFFKGRPLSSSEITLMYLLAWQVLPRFFEPGRFVLEE